MDRDDYGTDAKWIATPWALMEKVQGGTKSDESDDSEFFSSFLLLIPSPHFFFSSRELKPLLFFLRSFGLLLLVCPRRGLVKKRRRGQTGEERKRENSLQAALTFLLIRAPFALGLSTCILAASSCSRAKLRQSRKDENEKPRRSENSTA